MKRFTVGTNSGGQYIRALVGGGPSEGKTTFASTAPAPLFLSDAAEGGYKTLEAMAKNETLRSWWWDPKVLPEVWAVEKTADVIASTNDLRSMIANKTMKFQTLVVDSISVFSDRILAELISANPTKDIRQIYGDLKSLLYQRVLQINSLPMHVLWLCHVTSEGELQLAGKTAASLPAYMDYKWRMHVDMIPGKVPDYQLRTAPFRGSRWMGGRNVPLPDPMVPSFKCVAQLLALPIKPVSPACPPFGGVDYSTGADYPPL